jgi:hypothetical protein
MRQLFALHHDIIRLTLLRFTFLYSRTFKSLPTSHVLPLPQPSLPGQVAFRTCAQTYKTPNSKVD